MLKPSAYGGPTTCSADWLSAEADTEHVFSSVHRSQPLRSVRWHPARTDHYSVGARGGARFAKAFWQGLSSLFSQSPKVVEYQYPLEEPEQNQSSLPRAAWFPGCKLGEGWSNLWLFLKKRTQQ